MKRGSIYWINLEDSSPPEFGKIRPGLIISNSEQNIILPTVVIVPISSQSPEIWPLRLELKMPRGKPSYAVIPGIRQVSKERLETFAGSVSAAFLQKIEEAVGVYLAD